jgi:hypothetical protein
MFGETRRQPVRPKRAKRHAKKTPDGRQNQNIFMHLCLL